MVDDFVIGSGCWNSRFWMGNLGYVLVLHDLMCDTLLHTLEISILSVQHFRKTHMSRLALAMLSIFSLLSGCAGWQPTERTMDPPYLDGKIALPKYKISSCMMCTTGQSSTFAYLGEGQFSGAVYPDEISARVANIIRADGLAGWVVVGKSFDGKDQMFTPIRIFIPSLRPLVVMTSPWKYQTDPSSGFAAYDIGKETNKFNEMDYGTMKHFQTSWEPGIRIPFEFRSTLPKEATQVTVVSPPNKITTNLPTNPGESVSIQFERQTILFTREPDQKIRIRFTTM